MIFLIRFADLRLLSRDLEIYVDDNPEFDWLRMDVRQKINTWREWIVVPLRFFDDAQEVQFKLAFGDYVIDTDGETVLHA